MKYIQIGVTALRDPMTGEPLEAVPLYVREKDAEKLPSVDVGGFAAAAKEKIGEYIRGTRKT